MKRSILFISSCILLLSLGSCSIFGNKEYGYTTTKISGTDFYKRTTNYELEAGERTYKEITCYYTGNEICYVDVLDMFNVFKDNLSSDPNVFTNTLSNGTVKISFNGQNNKEQYITLDSKTNEVVVSSANFYSFYFEGEGTTTASDYETKDYAYIDKELTFNLEDYGLKSYYIDNTVLLPLSIFQLIYTQEIGYNYYYVNGIIHGTYIGNYNYAGSSLNDSNSDIRELNYNYLRLFLNKYYGLSTYKGYNDLSNVDTLLSKYKDKFFSNTKRDNEEAVSNILDYEINDLHTGVVNNSIYHGNYNINVSTPSKMTNIKNSLTRLEKQYQTSFGASTLIDPTTRTILGKIYNDTVYLKLDEFVYTTKTESVKNKDISNDTYTFMYIALNQLKSYPYIKNVVIDLTQNTGGAVISGLELLSFMTNDKIIWSFESLNQEYAYQEVSVDNDFDGDLTDDDAFTNYNYFIEISDVSFSCANLVPFIAKEYNYATIIGQTSSGGMGVVDYAVLPDGTYFQYSSSIKLNCHKNQESGRSCEDGVEPDITIPYNSLYDYLYIDTLINK